MENIFPGNAFRVGGDEFVIIETGIVKAQFFQKLDELRREMEVPRRQCDEKARGKAVSG